VLLERVLCGRKTAGRNSFGRRRRRAEKEGVVSTVALSTVVVVIASILYNYFSPHTQRFLSATGVLVERGVWKERVAPAHIDLCTSTTTLIGS